MAHGGRILVVDGLGHGPVASEAAHAAVEAFRGRARRAPSDGGRDLPPAPCAARAARRWPWPRSIASAGVVRFAGVGNVAGSIWNGPVSHHTVSLNGTAGHGTVRPREFSYPWPAGALLVMASDGLATRWTLEAYPGLAARDPALVAGVLYRDHSRGRDDVTVRGGAARRRPVSLPLLTVRVRQEQDVVAARQRARQLARLLGFDEQDQVRIATAVSELARNVFNYARGRRGRVLHRRADAAPGAGDPRRRPGPGHRRRRA